MLVSDWAKPYAILTDIATSSDKAGIRPTYHNVLWSDTENGSNGPVIALGLKCISNDVEAQKLLALQPKYRPSAATG